MRFDRLRLLVASLVLVLLPASGCSFVFVSGPPPAAERTRGYDCTQSMVVPVIDIALAALALASSTQAALATDEEYSRYGPTSRAVAIPMGFAWTVVYGMSALTGFRRVDSCREAVGIDPGNYNRPKTARKQRRAEEAAEEAAVQERREQNEGADEKPAP